MLVHAGLSVPSMVEVYMEALSTVYPSEGGRIQVLTSNEDDQKCPTVPTCPPGPKCSPEPNSSPQIKVGFLMLLLGMFYTLW